MRTRSKGERMKITGNNPLNPAAGTAPAAAATAVESTDRALSPGAPGVPGVPGGPAMLAGELASEVLKPALAAMPEIDETKVAALRDALAKGEIRFDANRLSQLIQRYHGGRA